MAVTSAVSDFVASIYELFASLLGAIYAVAHSLVMGVVHLFTGFAAFIGDMFSGVFDMVGGIAKFIGGKAAFYPPVHTHRMHAHAKCDPRTDLLMNLCL